MTDDVTDKDGENRLLIERSVFAADHVYFHMHRKKTGHMLGGHFPKEDVVRLVRLAIGVEIVAGKVERTRETRAGADLEQVGGSHYIDHKIRPWDIIDEYGLNFYEGNIVKYLLRDKPGNSRLEELEKLRHYADKCIDLEKE